MLLKLACDEDSGGDSISSSVKLLRQRGWLTAALPSSWGGQGLGEGGVVERTQNSVESLLVCAQINLSLARLFEGHVNALGLVRRYASAAVRDHVVAKVHGGALLGVWAADDSEPVSLDRISGALSGGKRYTSGLGTVTHAVVTAQCESGVRLCFVDVQTSSGSSLKNWKMNGMRASSSGNYCFNGIQPDKIIPFGDVNDFDREPGLVGGVWRIAALQLGGTYGLLEAARLQLRQSDRLSDSAQLARLTPLLYRAEAARLLVVHAARYADGAEGEVNPQRAVSLSIFSRLLTEELGQDSVTAVERSVGLSHFSDSSLSGRHARDLSTYLRQIAPDAFLQRGGRETWCSTEPLVELFRP